MAYTTVRFHKDKADSSYQDHFDIFFGDNKERCKWYCDSDSDGNQYPLLAVRKGGKTWYAPLGDPTAQSNLKSYQPLRVYKGKALAPNTWISNYLGPPAYITGGGFVSFTGFYTTTSSGGGTVYIASVTSVSVGSSSRTNKGFYDPVTISVQVTGGTETSTTLTQGTTSKSLTLVSSVVGSEPSKITFKATVNGTTATQSISPSDWSSGGSITGVPCFFIGYDLIS